MSHSTVNFISHKRTYCQLRYHQTRHEDVGECRDSEIDEESDPEDDDDPTKATVYVTPEDPWEGVRAEQIKPAFCLLPICSF